jgi:EAL domain-containing protein (putative c-di-GMP-specific phosphodiesterase class I)
MRRDPCAWEHSVEKNWYLETVSADGSRVSYDVNAWPFSVGRDPANHLPVQAMGLSRRHAQIARDADGWLIVTDLGSMNGTFVNRARIGGSCRLNPNDVVHFGNAEFRLGVKASDDLAAFDSERTMLVPAGKTLSEHFVPQERQFRELLGGVGISAAVQPIVDARGGDIFAYELLGRGTHAELPQSPVHLFNLAGLLDCEARLSQAFREHGIRALGARFAGTTLFVNTHPKETFEESFLDALTLLCDDPTAPKLVIEVHETAVMEVQRMRELAARLNEIGVRFAYDDFGAGQARLNELGDVPAHFVKFDMGLIRGIHTASERKRRVVGDLVRLVLDLGSVALAEGVECEEEAEVCRDMGFQLIQGYLTGKPVAVSAL